MNILIGLKLLGELMSAGIAGYLLISIGIFMVLSVIIGQGLSCIKNQKEIK